MGTAVVKQLSSLSGSEDYVSNLVSVALPRVCDCSSGFFCMTEFINFFSTIAPIFSHTFPQDSNFRLPLFTASKISPAVTLVYLETSSGHHFLFIVRERKNLSTSEEYYRYNIPSWFETVYGGCQKRVVVSLSWSSATVWHITDLNYD